jgi:nuclear pore complex protein Nup107
MTFELIELYHNIALETVDRLRNQHASERRKQDGARWRKKMRGFKISQDPELMDMDDMEDSGPSVLGSITTTIDDLERWEEEARTWDLLSRLVKLQYPHPGQSRLSNQQLGTIHRYSSERQIWEAFLEADNLALERQTVLRWLQDTAEESGEDIDVLVQELQQNAERGDIIAHGWLHTKAAIKNQKRVHVWSHVLDPSSPDVQKIHLNSAKTEPLVTQLDPDAPTRQNRKLEVQDQYFERAIWLGCYEMLRRGKSAEEIREWCGDRTEIWRAVSMCGLLDGDDEDHDIRIDNTSSTLWRRMCFALARRGGSDEYERAVYGILSGDLSTVEPVCRTWNDHLFAHYNALVKGQFENYLQIHHPSRAPADIVQAYGIFDPVQFHGEPQTAGKRLVNSLNKASKEGSATTRTMKMLQGVLIAKEFDNFVYQQGLALSKLANAETESILIPKINISPEKEDINIYIALNDYDSLRALVHMLLAFKSLGLDLGDMVQQMAIENVIVAYIGFLRLAGKEELIPLYASQLTGDRIYATLSRELVDVTDPDQRLTQIKLMKELGLDVQKFVRFQTQFLFMDFPDDSKDYPADRTFRLLEDDQTPGYNSRRVMTGFIGTDIDRTDLLLIRSLEWHLLVDGLWSETFATGVLLYKRFFSKTTRSNIFAATDLISEHARLAAAAELARNVSCSHISLSKTQSLLGESFDIVDLENEGEQEDITEQIGDLAAQMRLLKRYMAGEAKSFRELELLIAALEYIEFASDSISAMEKYFSG